MGKYVEFIKNIVYDQIVGEIRKERCGTRMHWQLFLYPNCGCTTGCQREILAFTWIKIYKHTKNPVLACGYWTRSNAEICILATKGKDFPRRISKAISQIIISPQEKHSKKPDEVRSRIVKLLGDLPRIELFARTKTDGWDVWGNEVNSDIELNSEGKFFSSQP